MGPGKNDTSHQYSKSSNPQRADKAARMKRREQYQYDLAQYNFYNNRKMVAHQFFIQFTKNL